MAMQLYNTLTRKTEQLKPIEPPKVGLYTCGPTVYSDLQIGNWLAYIRWDVLVRVLKASDLELNWVMNITDVGHLVSDADEGEDKMQKGAEREGKTAWEVAEKYTQSFLEGMKSLNISTPSTLAKATDHIPEQIDLIKRLEDKGYTYAIDDGVYYDTSKFPTYGQLAKLKLDELKEGARVEANPQKRNPTDFALWKFSPTNQHRDMEWESPWGKGFPGWHIECSAMAMKYLGETIDIHTGGIDHIPIHHTNEIAQSEGATGKPFVNIWVHSNFLTIDGAKLAKSAGNSFTLADLQAKGFKPMEFRLFALQSHYHTEANFTWESLEAARSRLKRWYSLATMQWQPVEISGEASYEDILTPLQHNLDTPHALSAIEKTFGQFENGVPQNQQDSFVAYLSQIDTLLGLDLSSQADISEDIKALLQQRTESRVEKDWEKSDKLRDQLKVQGIEIRDTPAGQLWSRG